MTNEDFDEFSKVVIAFAELRGKELSVPAQKLYFRALKHWQLDEFKRAAEHLLRTCEFMPTPKQFEDLRRAGEPTAAEAWAMALSACVNWRSGALPAGRIARAAAAVGGFQAIAMANTERDLPFVQKRFLEAYDELSDVEPVRDELPQIAERGARAALSAPADIAAMLPTQLSQRSSQPGVVALPTPKVATPVPKVSSPPPKSARDKILALLPLGMDDDAIAKVSREAVETVRQVRAEQECTA